MSRKPILLIPRWLAIALTTTFVLTGLSVSALAYWTVSAYWERPLNPLGEQPLDISTVAEDADLEPPSVQLLDPPAPAAIATQTAVAEELLNATNRVTVLVMGIDRRPGEPFVSRTDTMMLLSVDPEAGTAAMLSIPRDLYTDIPGLGRNRINTAFVYGAKNGGPAGGAQLAMETVTYNLGVPVDHYLLVDFSAFTQVIDTLGGIDVHVPREIYDPTFPDMGIGYDPLYIPAGTQHFDGLTALKYARTRHTDSDFGRAQRQQQVILAARQKALALGAEELLRQLPTLYQQVQSGVRTDLSLQEMVSLATVASRISSENIRSEVLDTRYVSSYTTPQGAQVLILDNTKAAPLIADLFGS